MKKTPIENETRKVQPRVKIQTHKIKKSVIDLAREIPTGKYEGISSILEPHEIPKNPTKQS